MKTDSLASRQPGAQPIVRIQTIERMLLRFADFGSPETRLAMAVICQAMVDCALGEPGDRVTARRFLNGPNLAAWSELVGLNPDFVRNVAIKTQYLATEPEKRRSIHAAVATREPHTTAATSTRKEIHDRLQ